MRMQGLGVPQWRKQKGDLKKQVSDISLGHGKLPGSALSFILGEMFTNSGYATQKFQRKQRDGLTVRSPTNVSCLNGQAANISNYGSGKL